MRGKSIMLAPQWYGGIFLLFRSKFLAVLLCLRSSDMPERYGTAALSSLAHLPTYNFHHRAVYFHINKAHPFKLGCEFNLEAGLSAKPPCYLLGRGEGNPCLLIIFVISKSCFFHVAAGTQKCKNNNNES